jgi:hypothetical protein
VWRAYDTYLGAATVNPGPPDAGYATTAGTGTVVWIDTGPSITNLPATNVAATAASLVGQLTATGLAPAEVFCFWGQSDGGSVKEAWETNRSLGVRPPGVLTNDAADLQSGAHYYYRFYATNAFGDRWGEPFGDFSTLAWISTERNWPNDSRLLTVRAWHGRAAGARRRLPHNRSLVGSDAVGAGG